ncbi:MAG: signal peptidase I [Clostridia bacterium]|nr:signal peptidase I [Clostridia bacterium]
MRRIEEFWIEFNPEAGEPEEKKPPFPVSFLFDVTDSVKGAVLVVFLIFALMFRAVGVDGDSMNPTLNDNDWVAVAGSVTDFERGDIVIVNQPWRRNVPIIKRVIAVGGDTINIDFNKREVYVNGMKLDEPYILEPTWLSYDVEFPLTVDEGKLFVMGDNRNDSIDSRSSQIGLIDERYVLGKALIRIYPFEEWKIYED